MAVIKTTTGQKREDFRGVMNLNWASRMSRNFSGKKPEKHHRQSLEEWLKCFEKGKLVEWDSSPGGNGCTCSTPGPCSAGDRGGDCHSHPCHHLPITLPLKERKPGGEWEADESQAIKGISPLPFR